MRSSCTPFVVLCLAVAAPLRAQQAATPHAWSWQGGGGVRYAIPMSIMSGYFGGGHGIAASLRASRPESVLRLAADAEYLHFPEYTVYRPYNGTGPATQITSAADIMLLGFGPALALRKGRFDAGVNVGAGGAYTHSSARTHIGTSPQNDRANTYTTFTWQIQGGAVVGCRLGVQPSAPRLELSGRVVHAGETDFLREYNLPVGVISGLYAKPTPYEPTFAVFALTLSAAL